MEDTVSDGGNVEDNVSDGGSVEDTVSEGGNVEDTGGNAEDTVSDGGSSINLCLVSESKHSPSSIQASFVFHLLYKCHLSHYLPSLTYF